MRIRLVLWTVSQGIKNIYRNKLVSFISLATMSVSIFLFSIFLVLFMNLDATMKYMQKDICITVFFDADSGMADISNIGKKIEKNENVDHIEYVSSDDAWKGFLDDYFKDDKTVQELFADDNPLSDSANYIVYLKDAAKQHETAEFIRGISKVRQVNESLKAVNIFKNIRDIAKFGSITILSILVCVSVFLIGSTIAQGIARRRDEIRIMKFCGATEGIIKGQFVIEGLIIGIFGTLIPLVVIMILYGNMATYISEHYHVINAYIRIVPLSQVYKILLPIASAMGIGIGYIGSRLAMMKHLVI